MVRPTRLRAGDFLEQREERPLARGGQFPVDRDELVAVLVVAAGAGAASASAGVEIAPGGAPAERDHEVVPGALEVEVVVLVEDDWLAAVALDRAGALDVLDDQVRVG